MELPRSPVGRARPSKVPVNRGGNAVPSRDCFRSRRRVLAFRRIGFALVLALALALTGPACVEPVAASGAVELEIWSDPQLELPIPKGWHRLEAAWVAERILIATPTPVEQEELSSGAEIDVPAILHVKIDALDQVLAGMSLDEIASEVIAELSEQMQEAGLAFEVLRREETSTGAYEAYRLSTRRDETVHHSLFVRTRGHLYEVTVAYEAARAEEFERFVEPVFAGVEPRLIPSGTTPMEERETLLARLAAPRGWRLRTVEGALPQVVLSREDVDLSGGRFETGISLLKVSQFRRAFGLPATATVDDMYALWLERYTASIGSLPHRLLQVVQIVIDAGPSLLIEASYRDPAGNRFAQLFNVVTAVGDDFYIATFEAPVEEFFLLRPAFLESIASLRWR